jgi:hypothetical protein
MAVSGNTGPLILLLQVRWQLFVNSLRRQNRRLELLVQSLGIFFAALFVLGTGIGFTVGAYEALRTSQAWILGMLLWVIFAAWQFAPILFEGYSPGVNFREIARYPVSFRLYFVLNCVYGLSDPAALASLWWMLCFWLGLLFARPAWSLPAAVFLAAFAVFNVFCNRLLIGLLERFQSTRKGRERMAVILLTLMVTPQLIQMIGISRMNAVMPARKLLFQVASLNHFSPPGSVFTAISGTGAEQLAAALLLFGYLSVAALLLRRQAHAVYLGELHSDGAKTHRELTAEPGWKLPGLDDIVSAVIEKEFRYLRQNARLLVQLVYPLVIFALMFSGRGAFRKGVLAIGQGSTAMLGMMAGFLLLSISNMAYNIFGLDREGFGRWLLAPVKLQKILLAKNLAQSSLFLALYAIVAGLLLVTTRLPWLSFAGITVSFVTVLVVQFGAGNLFSVWWPKKVDLSQMSSRTVSPAAGFASMLVILPVGMIAGSVMMASYFMKLPWLPLVAGLVLLAIIIRLYFYTLDRAARYIQEHCEEIEQTLSK